jgi:hypothetical protein
MPEKNGKSDLEAEKAAWESYLRRIEGTPEAAPAKKQGMSSAFRNFFSKLRFWGKKEKPAVAMEAGPAVPSAAEEIGFAAETPVSANELAEEKAIEQIIKAMQKRRAEGGKPAEMIAVPDIEVRPSERIELALSELQHMAAVRKAPIAAAALPIAPAPFIAEEKPALPPITAEKKAEAEKQAVPAKVALLPKMAPVVGQKPIAVEKPVFGKVPAKPAVAIPVKAKPAEKVTAKAIKKIEITPPLKKVSVQKLIGKKLKKI